MKLTIMIGGLSGGGAERVVCNLASYLVQHHHKVEILTMSDDESSYEMNARITRSILLHKHERKKFIFNSIIRYYRLCKYLRKGQVDAYIVMLPVTTILLLSLRFLTKSKVIAAERALPNSYPRHEQKQLRLLANRADGWIFQTQEQKGWYGKSIGKSQTTIIPNAINPDFLIPPYAGSQKKIIVSSGRLSEQKNHKLLINSFAKIADKYPDYHLIIYGEGPLRTELELLIVDLHLQDRVQLPGYTTNIGEKIKDASLFVLSSDFEGMPNALMEAMALGLPCVSTDCDGGGARFLIQDGINGLLVPTNDIQVLAVAMNRILSNSKLAETLSCNARKICDTLSPETIYSEWEKYILSIVYNY